MAYLFDTPDQRQKMFAAIGIQSIDELFTQIPVELQLKRELNLPQPISEMALQQEMEERLGDNPEILGRLQQWLGGSMPSGAVPGGMQLRGTGMPLCGHAQMQGQQHRGLDWIEQLVELLELKLEAIG